MTRCVDSKRREAYAEAAFNHVQAKRGGFTFGKNTYGFTLAKWRTGDEDYQTCPGFYVYCNRDDPNNTTEHRDFICFDSPQAWPFNGDLAALQLAKRDSYWRPQTHYLLMLLNELGKPRDGVQFKQAIGDRILEVFEAFERTEPDES